MKRPAPRDFNQIEMFPLDTLGAPSPKPKRRRIKPVARTRLSYRFQRKDLLPDGEGRMLPFDDEGDA